MSTQRQTWFLLFLFSVLATNPAFAQTSTGGADWLSPAQQGFTSLTTSLVAMGGGLIGLSIVAYGLWSAVTHRVKWETLWVFVFSGLIVTVGPAGIVWLIAKFQSSAS